MTKGGWVYIMTNRYNRVFYTGVTADLPTRVWQHRNGEGSRFCKRYNLTKLVYAKSTRRSRKPSSARSGSRSGSARGRSS